MIKSYVATATKIWFHFQVSWSPDTAFGGHIQYIPRNMHTVTALLCFFVVIHWLSFPFPSGLLHWHCGNLTIAPVPAKQPWWIWINISCEVIMNDCITTTKQSTTKPCAYFLGYTVGWLWNWKIESGCRIIINRANYVKYNYFCDGYSIDNVTLRIWEFSNFTSRHTVGIAGDDILFYILDTVYPKKYAHGFVVLCFVVVMQSFIMNSYEVFIHIHQGCFAGTGAIVRLPQCQWSKPDGYGKISQCITTTKHSKAKTVCIFLGIYCSYFMQTSEWMIINRFNLNL